MSQTRRQQFEAEMLYEVEPFMSTTKDAIRANLPSPVNIDWDGHAALVLVEAACPEGKADCDCRYGHRVMVDSPAEAYDLKYKIATKGLYHGLRVTRFA